MTQHFTAADIEAHQKRHHGAVKCTCSTRHIGSAPIGKHSETCPLSVLGDKNATTVEQVSQPQPKKPRMNKTETDFARRLEAQKQRGDVADYEFEALTLHWGTDEKTGKKMRYKPDFLVRTFGPAMNRIIEIKGGHIFSRDLVRFRGCRAEWQWLFDFELHQKKAGEWKRIE